MITMGPLRPDTLALDSSERSLPAFDHSTCDHSHTPHTRNGSPSPQHFDQPEVSSHDQLRRRSSTWSDLDFEGAFSLEEAKNLVNNETVIKPARSTPSLFTRLTSKRQVVCYNFFGDETEDNEIESHDDNEVYCFQDDQSDAQVSKPQTTPTAAPRLLFRFFSRNNAATSASNPNLEASLTTPATLGSSWWSRLTFGSNRSISSTSPVMEREMTTLGKAASNEDQCYERYVVQDNDETLNSIAARFRTIPSELKTLNRLNHDFIFVGQVLKIPKCLEVKLIDY